MCLGVIMVDNESRNLPTSYLKCFTELKHRTLKYYRSIFGYHILVAHTLSTHLSCLHFHKGNMVESHHEDPYYPAVVTIKWMEEKPGEVHEENLEVGP